MKKYSQNNEQTIIVNQFRHKKGTFLDLGAFDGVNLSNVRALAEMGWSGVMVEASPTVFKKLCENYKGFDTIALFNFAVSNKNGRLLFYDNEHAVATMHKSETDRWGDKQEFNEIEVVCKDIKEVLENLPYPAYDFVSIDCEGEDLTLLKRIDFNLYKTKMICVEWNGKDKFLYDKVLLPYGFRLIHKNGENLIYRR